MRAMHQAPRSLCIGLRAARSEVARVEAFCVHGRFSAPARQDRWCAYFGARRARFDTEHLTTRVEAILTPSPIEALFSVQGDARLARARARRAGAGCGRGGGRGGAGGAARTVRERRQAWLPQRAARASTGARTAHARADGHLVAARAPHAQRSLTPDPLFSRRAARAAAGRSSSARERPDASRTRRRRHWGPL